MRARFHPEARTDFKSAAAEYAAENLELSQRFYRHVDSPVADIEEHPTLFRVYRPPLARRHFRRPFPYVVVYALKPDHIWILAVAHFRQSPRYWVHRLEA